MEPGRLENSTSQQPVPVYLTHDSGQENEISLIDLLKVLRRRISLVLSCLLAAIILATAYIIIEEPVYQAETSLLPPRQQDIQGLLVLDEKGDREDPVASRYTPTQVFQLLVRNLKSQGLRREFFDAKHLIDWYVPRDKNSTVNVDKIFETRFNRSFQVVSDRNDPSFLAVRLSHSNPELAAKWLNEFVEFASERTIGELSEAISARIQAEIQQLKSLLSAMLQTASMTKHDRIVALQEALHIARALGISDSSWFPVMSEKNNPGIAVNTAQLPLYMRGVKALNEEITALQSRESEEAFIAGFREKQEKLSLLEGISINRGKLSATRIDMIAKTPYSVEKPRKKLVYLLSAVLGLLGGVIAVYIAEVFFGGRREQESV